MFYKSKALPKNIILTLFTLLLMGGIFLALPGSAPIAYAQSSNDLSLLVTGPTYVQAGGEIIYEFKLVNHTSQAYTDISFYNDLFDGVTYVSGGELNTGNPDYVVLTIPTLAPNATVSVSWVAQANSNLAVGTVLTNSSYGPFNTPAGAVIGYGSDPTTKVEAQGTLQAVYKNAIGTPFDVTIDSLGFENFVHNSPVAGRNFSDDLLPEDLFMYFGPDVCKTGNTAETCVLKAAAQDWLDAQIADMDLGVCEGMAAVSLHLFNQEDFKGYTSPASIQSGAVTASDLTLPGEVIENYVSYYYNTQYTDEVYNSQIYGTANETIATLTAGFNATPSIPYTLAIFIVDANGEISGGHAITPYGIEKVSDSESRILVYDNNFPKQRQYIVVNTAEDSWRYVTTATPGQDDSVYEGMGQTNKMALTPNHVRDNAPGEYFECTFCNDNGGAAVANSVGVHSATAVQPAEDVTLRYVGEGALLVVNEVGQETGHERDTGDFVDEIPGAEVVHHRGGLGLNVPPRITIPFSGADDTFYSVFVHANTDGNVTNGDLNIHGHGFSLGVNNISLDPFEEFELSFSPDGDHISFYATETIVAPELVIAHDPINPGNPSVIFDIEGITLEAGEKVMLDLDPELEHIHFDHTGPEAENFDIDMKLIWPDGDVQDWDEIIHMPAGTESAYIDFGAWDGLGHPPIYIDDVLQNPSVNHRLKLVDAVGTYDPTPQTNAPAGVYHVEATFQNVTEVAFTDAYFTVANLGTGDVLLNADANSFGTRVSVPAEALGADGILHMNESFTFSFDVGLADTNFADLTVDANGVPHDWVHPDPEPSYDANNASFVFDGGEALPNQLGVLSSDVEALLADGQLAQNSALRLLQNLDRAAQVLAQGQDEHRVIRELNMFIARVQARTNLPEATKSLLVAQAEFIIYQLHD